MKIYNTAPFEGEYLELLEKEVGRVIQGPLEADGLLAPDEIRFLLEQHLPDALIVEVNPVTRETLQAVDNLSVLAVCRNGTNNVDVESANEKGILVIHAPGRNAVAVAEFTIALMISIGRRLTTGVKLIHDRKWVDMVKTCYDLEGIELYGRTAGLVGVGAIGREVAKRLGAFGMRLLGYDPYVRQEDLNGIHVELTSLEDVAAQSDFMILLASVTQESKGMIDSEVLGKMKSSAYLISMARAALIDERALLSALQKHQIAGAALDVHEQEPLPFDSPWLALDNALLTPHLGGATRNVIRTHSKMIYEDLVRIQRGLKPLRLANPETWQVREK